MSAAVCLQEPPAIVRATAYVHPGQSFHSAAPTAITTILGSCVSVCLFDVQAGIGGITHYILPRPLPGGNTMPAEKLGTLAIPQLHEALLTAGARARRIQAKLFGGASMYARNGGRDLGAENVDVAKSMLAQLRVPIVGEDVGGSRGRKLLFHSDDGAVWLKYLGAER